MSLDVTYGNMTTEEANRLDNATGHYDSVPHEPGSTEAWISGLVGQFVIAKGAKRVLETGCFKGATSVAIAVALHRLGGGHLTLAEIDPMRASATMDRLGLLLDHTYHDETVTIQWAMGDVLPYLAKTPERFDIAFIDDDHTKAHVNKELELLYPKMNPGGLILLHDVWGSCDLQTVVRQWGGLALDLPRMGPAGGLGIIQCP